jgi:hypothetical protein
MGTTYAPAAILVSVPSQALCVLRASVSFCKEGDPLERLEFQCLLRLCVFCEAAPAYACGGGGGDDVSFSAFSGFVCSASS